MNQSLTIDSVTMKGEPACPTRTANGGRKIVSLQWRARLSRPSVCTGVRMGDPQLRERRTELNLKSNVRTDILAASIKSSVAPIASKTKASVEWYN